MRKNWTFLTLLALAALLLFANLGKPMLWQDEASTALISRTLFTSPLPLGTDGRNSFSQEMGAEFGPDHVWRWQPWLPFYVLAGFFKIFGQSTFVARFPFAFFGWLTVAGTMALARDLWLSRRASLMAGALLTLNIPFLLLSRQCRYYGISAFLSVAGLLAYRRLLAGTKDGAVAFAVAATLLGHTHPAYFAALLLTVLVDTLIAHRERLRNTALACAFSGCLTVPWYLWHGRAPYGSRYRIFDTGRIATFLWELLRQLGRWVVPLPFLLMAVLFFILGPSLARQTPNRFSRAFLPALFVIAILLTLSVATFETFFRYLTPVLPICVILTAGLIDAAWNWKRFAAMAMAAGALVGQPYSDYLYELTHSFRGPMEALIPYLNAHARKSDVVGITYGDLPLKFYTPLRVVGGLTGEDIGPARTAEWIVIRRYPITEEGERITQFLEFHVEWRNYERIVLDGPDTPWENRESPQEHLYRTASGEAPVAVYHRVRP